MTDPKELAAEIHRFLEKHAKTAGDYDPALDHPEDRFTGPDAALFHAAAVSLQQGQTVPSVWSEWGSGCYTPMQDAEAKAWHDRLRLEVAKLHAASRPGPRA